MHDEQVAPLNLSLVLDGDNAEKAGMREVQIGPFSWPNHV